MGSAIHLPIEIIVSFPCSMGNSHYGIKGVKCTKDFCTTYTWVRMSKSRQASLTCHDTTPLVKKYYEALDWTLPDGSRKESAPCAWHKMEWEICVCCFFIWPWFWYVSPTVKQPAIMNQSPTKSYTLKVNMSPNASDAGPRLANYDCFQEAL